MTKYVFFVAGRKNVNTICCLAMVFETWRNRMDWKYHPVIGAIIWVLSRGAYTITQWRKNCPKCLGRRYLRRSWETGKNFERAMVSRICRGIEAMIKNLQQLRKEILQQRTEEQKLKNEIAKVKNYNFIYSIFRKNTI